MMSDFTTIEFISRTFTTEMILVRRNGGQDSGTLYAAKRIYKQRLQKGVIEYVRKEKEIMETVKDGPFMSKIKYSFEDESEIIYIMEFLPIEDLARILRLRPFQENEIRFYGAELIVGLDFLHSRAIIHRDLKLENIGIDINGHIVILDFGVSKMIDSHERRKRTSSICGTAGYTAPEIRARIPGGYDNAVDWYSLGACFYRMLKRYYGLDPEDLSKVTLQFPDGISEQLEDLIRNLLKKDPEERLGGGGRGAGQIKAHPFFKDTDWAKVSQKKLAAPDISWIARKPGSSAQMTGEIPRKLDVKVPPN